LAELEIRKLKDRLQQGSPRYKEPEPSVPLVRQDHGSDDDFKITILQEDLAELKVNNENLEQENRELKMDRDHDQKLLKDSKHEHD
jgi:hypothetical protein